MGHFFKYAPEDVPYGKKRFLEEGQRLFKVLDQQLEGKQYVVGDNYTIADMAIFPWCYCVKHYYGMWDEHFTQFKNVARWYDLVNSRPGVQRGLKVTPFV